MAVKLTLAQTKKLDGPEAIWTPIEKIGAAGLPTVMRKVALHALKHTGETLGLKRTDKTRADL